MIRRGVRGSLASLGLVALGACAGPLHPGPAVPRDAAAEALSEWREIGRTHQDRPLRVRTAGGGPRRVLWIGGIHGNEREGRIATARLPEVFLERGLGERVTLTILEDANPDGSARNTRGNSRGVDLNRNFPARNFRTATATAGGQPLSQPESLALHDLILDLQPDLILVAHSWGGRTFVNFDGPAEAIARRFSEQSGLPMVRSDEFPPTPGSLGSWVGRDLGIPIVTIEWLRGRDPFDAWVATKEAILTAIAGEG